MSDNKKIAIGIDLGTTYSAVGIYLDGKVEIIANDQGNRTTPSWVAFTNDERLIGDSAKNQASSNVLNTIFDAKRLMGRKFNEQVVKDEIKTFPYKVSESKNGNCNIHVNYKDEEKTFSPEEVSAMILTKMKEIAESYLGQTVTDAVITVPAYFNDAQRQSTKDAGIIAGLNVLRIINEPTAAAIAYGIDKISNDKRIIIVIDLGGGTTDISLLSLEEGVFEVLATSGDTNLGGEDIDNILVSYIAEKLNLDLSDKNILKELKIKTEKIKKELSELNEVIIDNLKITRDIFNNLCIDIFKNFLKPIDNIDIQNVDDIILVGGTTRIPKMRELISDYFNNKKLYYEINPDEAVATGAAIQAAILSDVKDEKLEELDDKDREKLKFIEKVQTDKKTIVTLEDKREEEKKEWIKASFWAPDNTPMVIDNEALAPSKKLYCPAIPIEVIKEKHSIKLKELITLILDENDLKEYICWTC
jgi:L1 cell adhesion molecule like protein